MTMQDEGVMATQLAATTESSKEESAMGAASGRSLGGSSLAFILPLVLVMVLED